ncbi:hypothetical protein [Bradyrhizobium iriomotense]|uniref:Uncharacterized protein n=1 Tax=Bradyrhizobium iriomotense TaxID=441950 RepID=A0ABQ6B955_9BRAD|nr:hypothetical protein [Bradyrhizobium iriomotense]GLR89959.1 hypothetical protein GCM10007857_66730 [Bradyrhizobium iriomotense]
MERLDYSQPQYRLSHLGLSMRKPLSYLRRIVGIVALRPPSIAPSESAPIHLHQRLILDARPPV